MKIELSFVGYKRKSRRSKWRGWEELRVVEKEIEVTERDWGYLREVR